MSEPAHGLSYAEVLEKLKFAEAALSARPDPVSKQLFIQLKKVCDEREELIEALSMLYAETADYIRLNHLGDVHHNRSMQLAAAILTKIGPRP